MFEKVIQKGYKFANATKDRRLFTSHFVSFVIRDHLLTRLMHLDDVCAPIFWLVSSKLSLPRNFVWLQTRKEFSSPPEVKIYYQGSSHVIESGGRGFLVYVQWGLLSAETAILWAKIGNLLRLGCFDFCGMAWVYRRLHLETGYNFDSRTVPVQSLQKTLDGEDNVMNCNRYFLDRTETSLQFQERI